MIDITLDLDTTDQATTASIADNDRGVQMQLHHALNIRDAIYEHNSFVADYLATLRKLIERGTSGGITQLAHLQQASQELAVRTAQNEAILAYLGLQPVVLLDISPRGVCHAHAARLGPPAPTRHVERVPLLDQAVVVVGVRRLPALRRDTQRRDVVVALVTPPYALPG